MPNSWGVYSLRRGAEDGDDLIVRNLSTGQDVTISEVTEFTWDKTGAWLLYAVSSADGAKDGAFARRMSDGTVTTLHAGKGHYKSFAFDEKFTQALFMSDQAEYDVVKAIFEHRDDLINVHKEATNFSIDKQKQSASPIPFHPGAIKYFAERGIKIK